MNEGAALRLRRDPSVRSSDEGRVLVGGSPLRMLQVSATGAQHVRAWFTGTPVGASSGERALAQRLIDGGLAHPCWTDAPIGPGAMAVVLPVRDDTSGLRRTLAALAQLDPKPGMIVVVDDGSQDPEAVRVAAGSATVLRHPVSRGPAAARNTGLAHLAASVDAASVDAAFVNPASIDAAFPVVAFIDADCVPQSGWLDLLLAHFNDAQVVAVAPRVVSASGPSLLHRYEQARSPLDLGARAALVRPRTRTSYVPTACLVMRTQAAGFDESLRYGEDVDLIWRLIDAGAAIRYEPAAVVEHRPRSTWSDWVRQRIGYGSAAAPLAERHGAAAAPVILSVRSAAAWALAAVGHPVAGSGVAAASIVALSRKLKSMPQPVRKAVRLGLVGHLAAGQQLASAATRTWWPVSVAAALVSRRARRALLAAVVVPPAADWVRSRPGVDPVRWVALRLADDVSYGAGVWKGCFATGNWQALRPTRPASPPRATFGTVLTGEAAIDRDVGPGDA